MFLYSAKYWSRTLKAWNLLSYEYSCRVSEKNIGAVKMRNDYGYQLLLFFNFAIAIFDFSLLHLVILHLFLHNFFDFCSLLAITIAIEQFGCSPKVISPFGCTNNYFVDCGKFHLSKIPPPLYAPQNSFEAKKSWHLFCEFWI